jgi:hypothetical protein
MQENSGFTLANLSPRMNLDIGNVILRAFLIFQMAGRARRGQNERIPPPPPPTLQELMAQQNEILRQLAQRQPPPQHYGGGDHQRHPAAATNQEFLSTQPPFFTRAEDPLDADVWLRVVESKFPLLNGVCSDVTKVRFATQQLRGPTRTWWDHFLAMQQVDHEVEWREFKAAFRGIMYQQTLWTASSMSFWHSLRGIEQCYSMLRPSMTCARMPDTTQTPMRRRGTGSRGGSALSSATVLTLSGPTVTMNWSTWSFLRRTASQPVKQKRRGRPMCHDHQLSHSASRLYLTLRTGDLSSSKDVG